MEVFGLGVIIRLQRLCSDLGWALGWDKGLCCSRDRIQGLGLTLVLDGVVGQSERMQHTAPVLPKHPGQLLDKVPSGKGRKDFVLS